MRAPRAFDPLAVHFPRSRPPLGTLQHDERPARSADGSRVCACLALDGSDFIENPVEGGRHRRVHGIGLVSHDEVRLPPIAAQQALQLIPRNARQHGRVRNLVAIEVENRQHGPVGHGIEKLVRMPRRGERTRLGFSIAHHAGDDQVGIVESRAEGVSQRVAELASFVDRAGDVRSAVAGDTAGKRELLEQALHPRQVLPDIGV